MSILGATLISLLLDELKRSHAEDSSPTEWSRHGTIFLLRSLRAPPCQFLSLVSIKLWVIFFTFTMIYYDLLWLTSNFVPVFAIMWDIWFTHVGWFSMGGFCYMSMSTWNLVCQSLLLYRTRFAGFLSLLHIWFGRFLLLSDLGLPSSVLSQTWFCRSPSAFVVIRLWFI